jgi:SAM-dependent methyltransferase
MTTSTLHLSTGRYSGVVRIVRVNWPRYALAGAIVFMTACATDLALPRAVKIMLWSGASLALFWVIASIIASHWVYDRSNLFEWSWLREAIGEPVTRWINIHAGLDSIGRKTLRKLFPGAMGTTLDIFDPIEMTEPSIVRARDEEEIDPRTVYARFDDLPIPSGEADVALLLLAAHELRRSAARDAFFRELRRVVRPGGRVILVEHVRDLANFIAFGPGAFHFFSRRAWMRNAAAGGFELVREMRFTPLVRAFILRRES